MEAWAAEAVQQAKQIGTFEYPAFTWNLILTAVVGFMVWSLKRKFVQADDMKDKLLNQSIKSLEQKIEDWQTGAKERTKSLCEKIDAIRKDIDKRVHVDTCHERHEGVKEDISRMKEKLYT